jgi:predicted N-acyltransferase
VVVRQRVWPLGEKWVAVPYQFQSGAPIADNPEVAAALGRHAIEDAKAAGVRSLEVRSTVPAPALEEAGFQRAESGLQVTSLDLLTHDRMKIRRTTRAEVRYSSEAGVRIERVPAAEGMRVFLTPYFREMRSMGTPQAGRRFFNALVQFMPEHVHMSVARLGDNVLGAILVLGDSHAAFARSTSGTSTALGREHFVGKALMHDAIEAARARGVRMYHLGITWEKDAGLAAYKAGWGGVTEPVIRYVWSRSATHETPGELLGGYRTARRIWSRLPLVIAEPLGHQITRWIG